MMIPIEIDEIIRLVVSPIMIEVRELDRIPFYAADCTAAHRIVL
jgi:hypothetical protein